jgi:hypothetical protein
VGDLTRGRPHPGVDSGAGAPDNPGMRWMTIPRRVGLVAALAFMGLAAAPAARAQDDLCPLSDEFDAPATLAEWQRVHVVEQWNAEQLETYDINTSVAGRLLMVPYTCTWYQDLRGPMAFKTVTGDFAMTTAVRSTGRDGASVPLTQYSLGGLMIRTPRNITPATWTSGGENYVFLSLGYGNVLPRTFQYEVKTTLNGISTLNLSTAPGPEARLRLVRIGGAVITLRREPGQPWVVHRRYPRPDLPDTLQAGMVTYTNWEKASDFTPFNHNRTSLHLPLPPDITNPTPAEPFQPDLRTEYDYVRFRRPTVPPPYAGLDLTNPAQVSDAALLTFLGDSLDTPCPAVGVPERPDAGSAWRVSGPGVWRGDGPMQLAVSWPAGVPFTATLHDVLGRRVGAAVAGLGGGAGGVTVSFDAAPVASGVLIARVSSPGLVRHVRVVRLD